MQKPVLKRKSVKDDLFRRPVLRWFWLPIKMASYSLNRLIIFSSCYDYWSDVVSRTFWMHIYSKSETTPSVSAIIVLGSVMTAGWVWPGIISLPSFCLWALIQWDRFSRREMMTAQSRTVQLRSEKINSEQSSSIQFLLVVLGELAACFYVKPPPSACYSMSKTTAFPLTKL